MVEVTSINNLAPNATASEMEQAILAEEEVKAEKVENKEEVAEVVESEATKTQEKVEAPEEEVEHVESPPAEEQVEDKEYDYKKGYEGLRAWNTKLSQDLSEIKKSIQSVQAPKQEQPKMTEDEVQEWKERDPVGFGRYLGKLEAEEAIKPLKADIDYIKVRDGKREAVAAVSELKSEYKDFKNLESDIQSEIAEMARVNQERVAQGLPPTHYVTPDNYKQFVEDTYWRVKGKKSVLVKQKIKEDKKLEKIQQDQDLKDSFSESSKKTELDKPVDVKNLSVEDHFNYMKAKGLVPDY